MSKMQCRCVFVMTFHTGREEYDLALIPEAIIKDIGVLMDESTSMNAEKFYDTIADHRISVMHCPNCNRIWIERGKNQFFPYVPEPDNYTTPEKSVEVQPHTQLV